MTEVIKNFEESSLPKETAYQRISDLYKKLDALPIEPPIDYETQRKKVRFNNGSWLFINRQESDNVVSFLVNMNDEFLYRISQDTRDLNHIMVNSSTTMELGSFRQEVSASKNTWKTIPEEYKEDVFSALINWTKDSIRENKITEPPYNLAVT